MFCSVSVDNGVVVFSNKKDKTVYVAEKVNGEWKVTSSFAGDDTDFGHTVVIKNSVISVTANNKTNKAYLYNYNTSTKEWENYCIASIDEGSVMGWSSAFSGNRLAVGFNNYKTGDLQTGCVYYFDLSVATKINSTIANMPNDNSYYDMQGRKVINPSKGVYIHRGKLVIMQ